MRKQTAFSTGEDLKHSGATKKAMWSALLAGGWNWKKNIKESCRGMRKILLKEQKGWLETDPPFWNNKQGMMEVFMETRKY